MEIEDFLEHYGVRGQKWGVRRTQKKIAKADKKFERNAVSTKKYFEVYNAMANRMNATEIDRINNSPKFKGRRPLDDLASPVAKAYMEEYSRTATKILNEESTSRIGTNASGTRKVVFDYDVANEMLPRLSIVDTDSVTHNDPVDRDIDVEYKDGYIVRFSISEPMEQSDISVDEFLEHYGVRGQKWGVRKQRTAKDTQEIAKRKKVVSKRRTLSDKDIKTYIDRLSSEKKLKTLVAEDVSPGKTVVKKIMSESGQKVARTVVTGAALYAIKVSLDKKFNLADAAGFIAPKPKK